MFGSFAAIAKLRDGNPVDMQQIPLWYRPVWHVNHLVYQGGVPKLKRSSMTGGGFLPMKDFAGREAPSWNPYATITQSLAGSGLVAKRPNFLTVLGGGASTTSQF